MFKYELTEWVWMPAYNTEQYIQTANLLKVTQLPMAKTSSCILGMIMIISRSPSSTVYDVHFASYGTTISTQHKITQIDTEDSSTIFDQAFDWAVQQYEHLCENAQYEWRYSSSKYMWSYGGLYQSGTSTDYWYTAIHLDPNPSIVVYWGSACCCKHTVSFNQRRLNDPDPHDETEIQPLKTMALALLESYLTKHRYTKIDRQNNCECSDGYKTIPPADDVATNSDEPITPTNDWVLDPSGRCWMMKVLNREKELYAFAFKRTGVPGEVEVQIRDESRDDVYRITAHFYMSELDFMMCQLGVSDDTYS